MELLIFSFTSSCQIACRESALQESRLGVVTLRMSPGRDLWLTLPLSYLPARTRTSQRRLVSPSANRLCMPLPTLLLSPSPIYGFALKHLTNLYDHSTDKRQHPQCWRGCGQCSAQVTCYQTRRREAGKGSACRRDSRCRWPCDGSPEAIGEWKHLLQVPSAAPWAPPAPSSQWCVCQGEEKYFVF